MKTKLVVLLVTLGLCQASFAVTPAEQQADLVSQLFVDACLVNLGNQAAASKWARDNKLQIAEAAFSKAILRGGPGEVWLKQNPVRGGGHFLLVINQAAGGSSCAAWARRADPSTVNANVKQMAKGVLKAGLAFNPFIDKVSEGFGGQYRQFGFLAKTGSIGYVLMATTSQSEKAEVQARITLTPTGVK